MNIVGHSIGRRGDPLWGRRAPRLRSGDVVVDARLHAKRGTVIISAVTYLTAQERLNDFAVLKAVGGGTRSLAVSLALEAIASALLAAAVGIGVAQALAPSFPSRVSITAITYLELPLIAIVVGMVSSAVPLRRAIAVDPTLAFGG